MNKKQKTRINLLSTTEIDELYSIPIFNKKDIKFGTSSTTIKFEPFLLQHSLFMEVKARQHLSNRLHGPGCLNSLKIGN